MNLRIHDLESKLLGQQKEMNAWKNKYQTEIELSYSQRRALERSNK